MEDNERGLEAISEALESCIRNGIGAITNHPWEGTVSRQPDGCFTSVDSGDSFPESLL